MGHVFIQQKGSNISNGMQKYIGVANFSSILFDIYDDRVGDAGDALSDNKVDAAAWVKLLRRARSMFS